MNLKTNKIIKDINWAFSSLIISSFVHLLLRILLGRELGPDGLGVYTLVFTLYLLSILFSSFGIDSALTRYVPINKEKVQTVKEYVSSGVLLSFICGLLISFIIYVSSDFISNILFNIPEMAYLLKITAFCVPFNTLQKIVLGTLNGQRRMKEFAYLDIIQNTLILTLSVFFVNTLKLSVFGAVIGFIIPSTIVGIISLGLIRNLLLIPSHLCSSIFKDILWFGFYSMLAMSASRVMAQIDSVMIGHYMDETSVGYYSVAVILIQGIALLPAAVQKITTPEIARYYSKKDFRRISNLVQKTVLNTYLITLIITVLLAILGKHIISIIFTPNFLPAYTPLLILLIGYTIHAPVTSLGGAISSMGKVKITFKLHLLCTLINVLLNLILIPKFGLIGASTATSISLIIHTLIYMHFTRKCVTTPTEKCKVIGA